MSLLLLVRHAQASFHSADYDELSPLGLEQSRLLGVHWAQLNLVFDHVYVGPRRRHRQTHDAVAAVYRERGLHWPEPIELAELDEHCGQDVLTRTLPELLQRDPALRELHEKWRKDSPTGQRDYLRLFQEVTRMWARRELNLPDLEAWHEFRERVRRGLERIMEAAGGRKKIAVFSSGGPMASAVGYALELGDEKTLELSWVIRNGAYSEFLFSAERFSLLTFNLVPHLSPAHLLTFI